MCGIFAAVVPDGEKLKCYSNLLAHRGPDDSEFVVYPAGVNKLALGFHRLAIVDRDAKSNQPLTLGDLVLVCNGEIFNYKQLVANYNLTMQTGSDCEVILHLYEKFGRGPDALKKVLSVIEAEFAFVLYDRNNSTIMAARDPFGIRPLFYGTAEILAYASELKALAFLDNVAPFPPGCYRFGSEPPQKYYSISLTKIWPAPEIETIYHNIRQILTRAVEIRLMSDRPIGCFLSGGLDSSLVLALRVKYRPNIDCFSIGLSQDSYDIQAAKRVVSFLNARGAQIRHHIVTFTVEEGIGTLIDAMWHLETRCVTTIRAGIPNYLLSKYIATQTDIKVLYSGSGSDELFNGYQYGKMIKDTETLESDSARLLNELYLYDNLRDDRVTAAHGLELRVPFLDPHLINYVFSIPAEHRLSNQTEMEKMLLRDSFKGLDILPDEILYRRKEAFSDAVSSATESWYKTMVKYIESHVSDQDLGQAGHEFPFDTPPTKEAYYYRKLFEGLFPRRADVIPKLWLPPAAIVGEEVVDPSATILPVYKN
jgi:asparagine synthase (glutamine-hydrolysing)